MNHFPVLLLRNLHAPCASQARACVLCAKLLQCCCPRTWPARDPGTMQTLSSHFTFHTPHSTLHTCTSSQLISSEPFSSHSMSSHMSAKFFLAIFMSSTDVYYKRLHKLLPSTTLYCKACTKHVPVRLCTTKLAQNTSQYYFVLQSLHKALPSTTLYYKACTNYFPVLLCTTCTKHVPVLLCTTKLAPNTSQYYCVLQSLHKALPSTTLYYKVCTKHVPVLLCTTKLAQNTSQYYFVLQSLHKALPSTTLYYKACAKHFPVLLCTTKLAQNTSQYYCVLQSLHKLHPSTTLYYKACTKHFPVLLWPSNLNAAIPIRSAETELQNTIELCATVSEIAAPKPDLDAKATKRRFWSTF